MGHVLLTLALLGCDEPTSTTDTGSGSFGFQVQAAGFLGTSWGEALVGSADLVLSSTPLSCAELSDAAWGDTYYSDLQAGAGVVLRLTFLDREGGGLDPWSGTYAPIALVPEGDTGQPERLEAGRTARALWFDPDAWVEESSALVVRIDGAGPAGVGVSWTHPWGDGSAVAGACGELPGWLSDLGGPATCEAYVVSLNACGTDYGIGANHTPESMQCSQTQDRLAPYYLCLSEAYAASDCSTQDGWDAAAVAAQECSP